MIECAEGPGALINSFAVVTYIPEPLRSFLDALRLELAPNCIPRAHVTLLPPRPLSVAPETAWQQIRSVVDKFPCFEVTLAQVEVFRIAPVVYAAVERGWDELIRLHDLLNVGALNSPEPFPYHPHVTLAQEFSPDQLEELCRLARQRWAARPTPPCFRVETATFVQATADNRWVDLAERNLAPAR